MKELREDWLAGKPSAEASAELHGAIRSGGPADTSRMTLKLLNAGVAPQ